MPICSTQPSRIVAIRSADPVGHRQRLVLVVGDDDRRDAEPLLKTAQFRLHAVAQTLVERPERLVEQQQLRFDDQRPGQRYPLLQGALHPRRCASTLDAACLETEGDVLGDMNAMTRPVTGSSSQASGLRNSLLIAPAPPGGDRGSASKRC